MTQQTVYGQITDSPGDPGSRVGTISPDSTRPLTAGGGAQEISTVLVDTAASDTAYAYTYNAAVVTTTSDSSATKPEIADALADAHNASEVAASFGLALSDGVDTVTITAREVNSASGITDTDDNLTTAVTTAGSAGTAVPFGVGVIETAFKVGGLPSLGTAKVQHATPTAVNDATYTARVTGDFNNDGVDEAYDATFTADASATVQEIVEGLEPLLNAALPPNSVLVTEDDAKLIFTAEIPGTEFNTTASADGAATFVVTTPTPNARSAFAGVALKTQMVEGTATGAEYAADDTMTVLEDGEALVRLDAGQAPAVGDPVFIRASASGDEQLGAFRTDADTADAYVLPLCKWTSAAQTAPDGSTLVASLKVRLS